MNYGKYPDAVINEAVNLLRKGTASRDVLDILREKHGYELLDRRTVDRWFAKYPLGKAVERVPKGMAPQFRALAREEAERLRSEEDHRARINAHLAGLLSCVADLRGVEPFPLHHFDLALWFSRPAEPCWPMARGFICRGARGPLTVRLDVEERQEWSGLREHLPQDPLWGALHTWKKAVAKDMAARMALLSWVAKQIQHPASRGGLGLPVVPDIGFGGTPDPSVSLSYAFSICDRTLSMALGLRPALHGPDAFTSSLPGLIDLEGRIAISASDAAEVARAKDFLYRTEATLKERPDTEAAAQAYLQAMQCTEALEGERQRVQAMGSFPLRSICNNCKLWAIGNGRGIP